MIEQIKIEEKEECCGLLHLSMEGMREIQNSIPSETELANLSDFFKIFGDGTRIRILYTIGEKELCVCDIARTLNMTDSAISHQLRVLKANRLVKSRREGKSVFYELDDGHIKSILTQGLEHVKE